MSSKNASPSLRAFNSRTNSPSPCPPTRRSRPPQIQSVNTSYHSTIMVTPISASASAQSASSVSPSPNLYSLQSSPSTFQGTSNQWQLGSPAPLELGESMLNNSQTQLQSRETPVTGKPGSLMRKLSQTAKDHVGRTLRRKASSNYQHREESSGPLTRRRSDSKTTSLNGYASEVSFDTFSSDLNAGLGLLDTLPSNIDMPSITNGLPAIVPDPSPEGVAPAVPESLVAGCRLTKVTKNKATSKVFSLDTDGTRVFWTAAGVITKHFLIDNIKSIRSGEETSSAQYELKNVEFDQDCLFTVNYLANDDSKRLKTLHLVTPTRAERLLWVDTLEALSKHREDMMTGLLGYTERENIIRSHWDNELQKKASRIQQSDPPGLDLTSIEMLCRKLHVHCSRSMIVTSFKLADDDHTGELNYQQFKAFLRRLRERHDVRKIFDKLKDDILSNSITQSCFLQFIEDTQKIDLSEPSTKQAWVTKISSMAQSSASAGDTIGQKPTIDYDTLLRFMLSPETAVYQHDPGKPKFDRPLNEYFISSSHNTYLTGRQVAGQSSPEAYVSAIRRGCRCVEIDCWDGKDGHPRVTHGHTRTTSYSFSDCLHAINQCAFDVSPYPLIVSLEVHCSPEQQRIMVCNLRDVFGERLLLSPLSDEARLPTPEDLKYRILVKVKASEALPDFSNTTDPPSSKKLNGTSPPRTSTSTTFPSMPPQPPLSTDSLVTGLSVSSYSPRERSMTTTSASSVGDESDQLVVSPLLVTNQSSSEPTKIVPELADTGVYLQGYSFTGPADLGFKAYNHIFSLNEYAAAQICNSADKHDFEDHNVNHMARVYPKQARILSTNFDPNTFWRRGVQMVALNWQTFDVHMQMNAAMFASGSDQYGYVQKPAYLRQLRDVSGDFALRRKLPRYEIKFSVEVISAQQLPKLATMGKNETVNPFIEVQIWCAEERARRVANGTGGTSTSDPNGSYGQGRPYTRQTKMIENNGYNPQFDEKFELGVETKYPELVFVRFVVFSAPDGRSHPNKSRQVAVFTAKLNSLQQGYRHLPLFNGSGEEFIFSTLFCKITRQEPQLIPSSLQDLSGRNPRMNIFRNILSRTHSSDDRGRKRLSSLDEERSELQKSLCREIEQRARQK